jgi:hypothetical protein
MWSKGMSDYPDTPELDRMSGCTDESQIIGSFIDWLATEARFGPQSGEGRKEAIRAQKLNASPVKLCLFDEKMDEWRPVGLRIEEILARYYDIDLNKVEDERRAILEHIREKN